MFPAPRNAVHTPFLDRGVHKLVLANNMVLYPFGYEAEEQLPLNIEERNLAEVANDRQVWLVNFWDKSSVGNPPIRRDLTTPLG